MKSKNLCEAQSEEQEERSGARSEEQEERSGARSEEQEERSGARSEEQEERSGARSEEQEERSGARKEQEERSEPMKWSNEAIYLVSLILSSSLCSCIHRNNGASSFGVRLDSSALFLI